MTPKEKAIDIAMRFDKDGQTDNAVKCALICVDEIINSIQNLQYNRKTDFWENVKKEIEKL